MPLVDSKDGDTRLLHLRHLLSALMFGENIKATIVAFGSAIYLAMMIQ